MLALTYRALVPIWTRLDGCIENDFGNSFKAMPAMVRPLEDGHTISQRLVLHLGLGAKDSLSSFTPCTTGSEWLCAWWDADCTEYN